MLRATYSIINCINVSRGRAVIGSVRKVSMQLPAGFCPPKASQACIYWHPSSDSEVLTTYGTAGSQTSYPSFMSGASDKVLKGADITGISFPLSHISAFAMGTFLVDTADILVCPRNK